MHLHPDYNAPPGGAPSSFHFLVSAAAPVPHTDWLTLGTNTVAVLLGALIAGVASFWAARITVNDGRKARASARTDENVTSALRTTTKLMLLTNSLAGYRGELLTMARRGVREMGLGQPWRFMLPIAGGSNNRVFFTADDLLVLARAGEHDLLSRLLMLANKMDAFVDAIEIYRDRRAALLATLPSPEEMRGIRGSADLTEEQQLRAAPGMVECNSIIGEVLERSKALLEEAVEITREINPALRNFIPDKATPLMGLQVELPPEEEDDGPIFPAHPRMKAVAARGATLP